MTRGFSHAVVLLAVLSFAGCSLWPLGESRHSVAVPAQAPQKEPIPTPAPPRPAVKPDPELKAELEKIAADAEGKVGAAATVLETGEYAAIGEGGRYPMMSVYKVPIAMTVLKMIDDRKVRIDQEISVTRDDFPRWGYHSPIRNMNPQGVILPVGVLLRYSVSESDGTATDVLLDLAGGPAAVQKYLESLGISDMIVANSVKELSKDWETQYRNWSTPEASIELLRAIYDGRALSEASTRLLLQMMTDGETGKRRLQGELPDEVPVAHKTGTGGTKNGITGATNDFGIITMPDGRRIAIAVYVTDSSADMWMREKVIARIAKAVFDKWGGQPEDDSVARTF